MTEKHHPLGPSKVGDSIPGRCQGKHRMEAGLPDLGEDRTGFGTDLHASMEVILNRFKKTRDSEDLNTDHIKDHDKRFAMNRCIRYLFSRSLLEGEFDVELWVEIFDENGKKLTHGTLDFVAYHESSVTVVDWKTHRSELDEVSAKCQIAAYICGACQKAKKNGGRGYLYLPFLDTDYEFDTTMVAARDELSYIIRLASKPDSPIAPGSWCKYCKAKFTCPALMDLALSTASDLPAPADFKTKKDLQKAFEAQLKNFAANGSLEKVAAFGEMLSTLEPAMAAWRSVVKELMENGHEKAFPNWEIKERQGSRHAGVLDIFEKVQSVVPSDQFARCASVKWGELEEQWIANIQMEAEMRNHKIPKTKAKKMLDDLIEPMVTRTSRKELWRKK